MDYYARKLGIRFSRPFERVMIFIDGGYLRGLCKKFVGHDNVNWEKLCWRLVYAFNTFEGNPFNANLIRVYYYDAIVDKAHSDYDTQRKYFDHIGDQQAYTVRLGEVVQSSKKGLRQKGVDVLMAIDVLSKAYENQYDAGVFLMGDRDFQPLIEAVKHTGKKTVGVYNIRSCADDLARSFDMRLFVHENAIREWTYKRGKS